jgi:imidazolonepropionase
MKAMLLKTIKKIYKHPSENQSIFIRDGVIDAVASFEEIERSLGKKALDQTEILDCSGAVAVPGFVDSHTHLLFAGSRHNELYQRAGGADYLEILKQGGGIHNTVRSVRGTSEEELIRNGQRWLDRALRFGTTTIEIKSGYGLDYQTEKKMLKTIRKLNTLHPVDIVPTFLVHTIPLDADRKKYLSLVADKMIPEFREYADWFDLFLEKGVFDLAEAEMLIRKARDAGYRIGLHANQVHDIGGINLALDYGVRHVDHLEVLNDRDAKRILANPSVYPVFLPGAEYHLFSGRIGQIHKLTDARSRIVLATDFNPGSSPVLSPSAVMALAVLRYRVNDPSLLLDAFTSNPADMLFLPDRGRIEKGAKADILLFDVDHSDQIPYWGTVCPIRNIIKNGRIVKKEP